MDLKNSKESLQRNLYLEIYQYPNKKVIWTRMTYLLNLKWIILNIFSLQLFFGSSILLAEKTKLTPLGMWVWPQSAFTSVTAREDLFNFCEKEKISHLDVHLSIKMGNDGIALQNHSALTQLLVAAKEGGFSINALRGSRDMFFEKNWEQTLQELEVIIDYTKSLPEGVFMAGVKYDVEPYTSQEWKAGGKVRIKIMQDYLAFLTKAKKLLMMKAPNMELSVDVPFWWDQNQFKVLFEGEEKLFSEHVQNLTDYIGIMSYRPKAYQVLKCVEQELFYAEKVGKLICPGLETMKISGSESWISFYEHPTGVFRQELRKLQESFAENTAVKCIMLHHYSSLVQYLDQ